MKAQKSLLSLLTYTIYEVEDPYHNLGLSPCWIHQHGHFKEAFCAYEISTKTVWAGPNMVRPNKNISVFRVTGLIILGRVGTYVFISFIFFLEKNI